MKQTRLIMGMPITVEVVDATAKETDLAGVFDYFTYIDETFSTYKPASEMMRINRGEVVENDWSDDMRIIFMLAEETKQRTDGFFDIQRPRGLVHPDGGIATADRPFYDPSGIVKGWAIWQAAKILAARGLKNYYIEAGGDIQTSGAEGERENAGGGARESRPKGASPWTIGIKNPFKKPVAGQKDEIVKTIYTPLTGLGVATSGTYIRGEHIYNPKTGTAAKQIISLTIIGPNIYEADRFATAAFAMDGERAIRFIESLPNLEGYMINANGIATMTTGFKSYTNIAP